MKKGKRDKALEDVKLFFKGAFDMHERSSSFMKKEAHDEMDNFLLICYGDLLGIPLPTSYYMLELLPYLAEDLDNWEKRILRRQSVVEDRWGDFCC
ncbi:MAG: hypothetical protein N4A76_09415 [Firmicutes bacterium]|jgi:hypothetical protein|nr:hypothetical protein [Bacillota bacterium]